MEEKDYIDKLILENLDKLNDYEPPKGHFDRFETKLKGQHKSKLITFNRIWKVAAAVVFVLLATNQAFMYLSPDNNGIFSNSASENEITLASLSNEYKEVEFFYTNAINTGMIQWNSFAKEGFISKEEQEAMDAELREFEEIYKSLQNDLSANPNDERVINAMLEYYQAKLNVINMIVNKLQEVKETNKMVNSDLDI